MGASVARAHRQTEGNDFASDFHGDLGLETTGNSISRECLIEAIGSVPHKELAGEIGMSRSQFSKSLTGQAGGDFNAVIDRIRPSIRLKYAVLIQERENGDPSDVAARELAHAAIRYLSTRRIPLKAAKAGLR